MIQSVDLYRYVLADINSDNYVDVADSDMAVWSLKKSFGLTLADCKAAAIVG